jgi:hypothetical protein
VCAIGIGGGGGGGGVVVVVFIVIFILFVGVFGGGKRALPCFDLSWSFFPSIL